MTSVSVAMRKVGERSTSITRRPFGERRLGHQLDAPARDEEPGNAVTAPVRFPRFFVTSPAPCPYLPGKVERKVFTELSGRHAGELNEALGRIDVSLRTHADGVDQARNEATQCVGVFEPTARAAVAHSRRNAVRHARYCA